MNERDLKCSIAGENMCRIKLNPVPNILHRIFFWECKGDLLVDFMQKDTMIDSNWYCETLRKLQQIKHVVDNQLA